LRKAETQTFVSSRPTSGTAFRLDLGPCSSHFRLDDLLWDRLGASSHPTKQAVEFLPPPRFRVESNQDTGLLLQSKWLERSQHPILVHRSKRFFYRTSSSRLCHSGHYSDALALGSRTSRGRIGL
jgi:hypothetical protein